MDRLMTAVHPEPQNPTGRKWTGQRKLKRLGRQADVNAISEPGRYSDGGNLILVVDESGAKRWLFRFRWKRKGVPGPGSIREMGLGSASGPSMISVDIARKRAMAARVNLDDGIDPIKPKLSTIPTFGELADELTAKKALEYTSEKSMSRLKQCLEVHAKLLRPMRVDAIEPDDVLKVIQPIWVEKTAMARKTRGYIAEVIDYAKAKRYRQGDNPADMKGNLAPILPKIAKLSKGHHKALDYAKMPAFMANLRGREAPVGKAMQFLVLTTVRLGQVSKARWEEIDWEAKVWTIPPSRNRKTAKKTEDVVGVAHQVPLSDAAIAVLKGQVREGQKPTDLIFPSTGNAARPFTDTAFSNLWARMGYSDITTHGFRSTFSDWVGDCTEYDHELAELALAHKPGTSQKKSYRHKTAVERRRAVMGDWATYCLSKAV